MAARASFSSDHSRIVNISLPNSSLLLKDYLLDDLSSCSSNGFRSYPRRQCCTKVRYLIEIDLNKHVKLPSTQKQLLRSKPKSKAKSKSKSVLHKASAAVVKVFKNFHVSNSGSDFHNAGKSKHFLPRNLSRKLSKHGFWKKTVDRNNSFNELIGSKHVTVSTATAVEIKTSATSNGINNSNSNSNSSVSADSYFTATSGSSTTRGSAKINAAQNVVKESDGSVNGENAVVTTSTDTTTANGNAQKILPSEEKDHFSPISVMDFPNDNENENEDEVTSPFHASYLHIEGSKPKLIPKVQRIKSTLKPLRLEDRITLSESKTHTQSCLHDLKEEDQTTKKAIALLQLFKATMPSYGPSEPVSTESFLLEFFAERVTEGNKYSNYAVLQDAKDWMNGVTRDKFESDEYCKLAYVRDMEKAGGKWLSYDREVEIREVVSEVEYEIFTSLVAEMSLDL